MQGVFDRGINSLKYLMFFGILIILTSEAMKDRKVPTSSYTHSSTGD